MIGRLGPGTGLGAAVWPQTLIIAGCWQAARSDFRETAPGLGCQRWYPSMLADLLTTVMEPRVIS